MNPPRNGCWKGMEEAGKETALLFAETTVCEIRPWKFRLFCLNIHHSSYEYCY